MNVTDGDAIQTGYVIREEAVGHREGETVQSRIDINQAVSLVGRIGT